MAEANKNAKVVDTEGNPVQEEQPKSPEPEKKDNLLKRGAKAVVQHAIWIGIGFAACAAIWGASAKKEEKNSEPVNGNPEGASPANTSGSNSEVSSEG